MFLRREPTAEPGSLVRSPKDVLSINFIISFGICSTPKEPNMLESYYLHTMPPNEFQYCCIHQD